LNVAFQAGPETNDNIELHLWTYKPELSLDHLRLTMQESKEDFPIFWDFLQLVRMYDAST